MTEMIERVARALATSAGGKISGPGQSVASREAGWKMDAGHLREYVERHWKEHVHAAEFAIGAMREPSPGLIDAGLEAAPINWASSDPEGDLGAVWAAMIDAALIPPSFPPEWGEISVNGSGNVATPERGKPTT